MTRHHASVLVPAGIEELYDWLMHVEQWPRFVEGLESVEPLGHHRYRWSIRYMGHGRSAEMVVGSNRPIHRIRWQHVQGRAFDGAFGLSEVGQRATKVDVNLNVHAVGLLDGVLEPAVSADMTERTAQRLATLVREGALTEGTVGEPVPELSPDLSAELDAQPVEADRAAG